MTQTQELCSLNTKQMLLVGESSSHRLTAALPSSTCIFQGLSGGSSPQSAKGERTRRGILEGFCGPGLGVATWLPFIFEWLNLSHMPHLNLKGKAECPGGRGFGEELTNCYSGLLRIFASHILSVWNASPDPASPLLPRKPCGFMNNDM